MKPGRAARARARVWTAEEENRLRKLFPTASYADLEAQLNRTVKAVKSRAKVLGLKRAHGRQPWTAEQIAALRERYPWNSSKDLAGTVGHSASSVEQKAKKLGLRRDPEYKRQVLKRCGEQISRHPRAIAARIRKGNVPSNKGLRRPGWFRGRMRETQFKKGQRCGAANNNWCPVGTIKPNADGYLRLKVADQPESIAGKGATSTNWVFLHRKVWEEAHGPIPKGHRIWWKDGNHENCAIENLELLSDQEHMARTTIHRLPPKLKRVIILKGAIKRRITLIEKGKHNGGKQRERQHAGEPERNALRNAQSA